MRIGVKALTFLLTASITMTLGGCSPIVDNTPVGLNLSSVEDMMTSSDTDSDSSIPILSSSESQPNISSGTISGGKGNLIIVDKDKDVGSLDDPEDPMAPSHSAGTDDEKPPEDTITIPPTSSNAASSSAISSSSVTTSKPSSLPNSSTIASVSSAISSDSLLPPSGADLSSVIPSSNISVSSGTGTSSILSSSDTTSSKPPFAPPANGWYTYEGKTYLYQNSKPVTGYQTANGVTYYFDNDGVLSSKVGIDVSKYQGDIDWNKVKNDGVEFAIIRIGYRGYGSAGTIAKDPKFLQNIINATNVGIDCGLYFFTQAINKAEAEEEAVKVVEWINEAKQNTAWTAAGKKKLTYPIYFDTEMANISGTGRADKLTKAQRTETAMAFCNKIKALGYYPGIYASTSWLNNQLNMSALSAFDVWVAHYTTGGPTYKGAYRMWQYTSKGTVNGIAGDVDRNVGLFDYPDYIRQNGWNDLILKSN
ncbi:MAG: GH25 family lysozyme [Clostridiales bacterium]|nr:GH25 family lysozyme [Clostridiales bacterium]